jgi:hypothetical protein
LTKLLKQPRDALNREFVAIPTQILALYKTVSLTHYCQLRVMPGRIGKSTPSREDVDLLEFG